MSLLMPDGSRRGGLFLHDDLALGGVFAHGSDAVQGAVLGFVAFALADGLAVAGLQAEAELTGLVGVQLILGVSQGFVPLHGLIFHMGQSIFLDRFDAVFASGKGREGFAGGQNDLAVGGLQAEGVFFVFGLLDDKFTHDVTLLSY